MERPLLVARSPRIFAVQVEPPLESRVFVCDDQLRWYERRKDENGDAYYVHAAETDEELQLKLEREAEPAVVELTADDALAGLVLEEFGHEGYLLPEVPILTDEGLGQAAGR